jgi:hypothetical protein
MARPDGIPFEQIEAMLARLPAGLAVSGKAAWVKVTGPNGHRVYIAKQKVARQVDLSMFGRDLKVGIIPSENLNGQVQAHLDMSHPWALSHLEILCHMLLTFGPPDRLRKRWTPKIPITTKPPTPTTANLADLSNLGGAAVEARRKLIQETAARMGMTVSKSTQDKLDGKRTK